MLKVTLLFELKRTVNIRGEMNGDKLFLDHFTPVNVAYNIRPGAVKTPFIKLESPYQRKKYKTDRQHPTVCSELR